MKKFLSFSVYLLFIFLNISVLSISPIRSKTTENIQEDNSKISDNYLNIKSSQDYILGIGDVLSINLVDKEYFKFDNQSLDENTLDKTFQIDSSGTIYLPILKRVFISGLTISELTQLLNNRLKEFVKVPDVKVTISKYRPIRVVLSGEVTNPGIYYLTYSKDGISNIESSNSLTPPRISDLLKESGGITRYSDLENIEVIRKNSISNGGGHIRTRINFLSTLSDVGGINNDIKLYDEDLIKISQNKNPLETQISKAIKSNLNPKQIKVYIAGNVEQGGLISLLKNTTLNDAIEASGGTKILSGKVFFTRSNNSGEVDKRNFRYNLNAKRGGYKNPYLQNGDIIFIKNSLIGKSGEFVQKLISPIVTSYGAYKIFDD